MSRSRLKQMFGYVLLALFILGPLGLSRCAAARPDNTLWNDEPAQRWLEAFPVGNGRLGAMAYGGVHETRFRLNEESLWAGRPLDNIPSEASEHLDEIRKALFEGKPERAHKLCKKYIGQRPTSYRSFQPLGTLSLNFPEREDPTDYRRELHLRSGIARTLYRVDDTRYVRSTFASAPDDVLVVRMSSHGPETITTNISLTRSQDAEVSAEGERRLVMEGQIVDVPPPEGPEPNPGGSGPGGKHMRFASHMVVRTDGGSCSAQDSKLHVEGADSVTIILTAATDYSLEPVGFDRDVDPSQVCRDILDDVSGDDYEKLRGRHVREHRSLFDRVKLEIGDSPRPKASLDERLGKVKDGARDPELIEQYFQLGRYLLMNSSREPGRLPANLQGLWSNRMWAAWEADYHLNINLQMNYWPADVCGLGETIGPLANFMDMLSTRGRKSARGMYNSAGWMAHHCTNVFGRPTPSGSTMQSQIINGLFPTGGAWMTLALWRHYEFSGDRQFLRRRAYPIMKGASRFFLDYMTEGPEGWLVTGPSNSPENNYVTPDGKSVRLTYAPTADVQVIHALFERTIAASRVLDRDEEFREKVQKAMEKLPPQQVGENGTLQEWIKDYREAAPGHRHFSHLIGFHPADWITPETPELLKAVEPTIERRLKHGGGSTGWSRAWCISFFARLRDGDRALDNIYGLLRSSTAPNLFDRIGSSPPFQIDGNFGGTAGVAEMLLQSHRGKPGNRIIDILPALPSAWPEGEVSGLRARGGFVVDIDWEAGEAETITIHSEQGNRCRLHYGDTITFNTTEDRTYVIEKLGDAGLSDARVRTKTGEDVSYETK